MLAGQVGSRLTLVRTCFPIGTRLDQHLRHLPLAQPGGAVQTSPATMLPRIGVTALLQNERKTVDIPN